MKNSLWCYNYLARLQKKTLQARHEKLKTEPSREKRRSVKNNLCNKTDYTRGKSNKNINYAFISVSTGLEH